MKLFGVLTRAPIRPPKQPGWRLSLEGFHPIAAPVTFGDLREAEDIIRVLESELEDRYGRPLYTPFETGTREIRPKQAYLTKLPADLVEALPSLRAVADQAKGTPISSAAQPAKVSPGELYRRVDEDRPCLRVGAVCA